MKVEVAKKTPEKASKRTPKMSEEKQKKAWMMALSCLVVLMIGLVIAIVVVVSTRENNGKTCTKTETELTEEEKEQIRQDAINRDYNAIQESIAKIVKNSNNPTEETMIYAYQYYISQTNSEVLKRMLRSDLLLLEMGYDVDKVRGDELIAIAIELDEETKTSNSAGIVMILAENYGKTEIYAQYEAICNERMIAEGAGQDGEGEG